MRYRLFPLIILLFSLTESAISQTFPATDSTTAQNKQAKNKKQVLNSISVYTTILPHNLFTAHYERVINKQVTFRISYRRNLLKMLPIGNIVINAGVKDRPEMRDFTLSNVAITPEIRIYLGKAGFERGFFVAPFYKSSKFKTNELTFNYVSDINKSRPSLILAGKLASKTGGLMIGAKYPLGKRICFDWWILGPRYGSGSGTFSSKTKQPLTQEEQRDLRDELNRLDVPFTKKTVVVNENHAAIALHGLWGAMRGGITFGIRF